MTPHEKAVNALNSRLERLQANLREAKSEGTQQVLFQALIVTVGLSDAMTDYINTVGVYARRRHGEFKEASVAVGTQHADLLKSGKTMLEQLKANPADRTLRKEIDRAQRGMATIQKGLRRDAFSVQRELALTMAMIDTLAVSVRRVCEADRNDVLKRVLKEIIAHVKELYTALETTRSYKDIIDVASWEKSATSAVEQAVDFHNAYARAGYQAMLAIHVMTMAVSENPPCTAEDATQRANESVSAKLKTITARFTDSAEGC